MRLIQVLFFAACLAVAGFLPLPSLAAGTKIMYPKAVAGSDAFINYYWKLAEAALAKTTAEYGPYELLEGSVRMNHQRAMQELVNGNVQLYSRAILPPELADKLDLVPFPLDKGLLGYRLFLIHKDAQEKLATVNTLKDLQAFSMGQAGWWADVAVLNNAGLNVVKATSYDGLFPMLQNKHIDLFPRGANEVLSEYNAHKTKKPELVIENHLALVYPQSFYFMVRKDADGEKLKARLLLGLQRLRADGSFDRAYQELKKAALTGLNLKGRTVIRIDNPSYGPAIYMRDQKDMWDTLEAESRK